MIDAGTAEDEHLSLGSSARIAAGGSTQSFRVVGIAKFGTVKSLGTATFAVFDLRPRRSSSTSRAATTASSWRGATARRAPRCAGDVAAAVGGGVQVQTAAAQDRFTLDGLKQFITIIKVALLVFGGVAILVGAFTIFNALSITIAQRTRELGLLRMVGAGRRQVLGSVLLEALTIGLLASLVGLVAGLGIAKGLNALFVSLGLDLPEAGTVFASRTIVVSLLRRHAGDAGRGPAARPGGRRASRRSRRCATPTRRRAACTCPGRVVRALAGLHRPPGAGASAPPRACSRGATRCATPAGRWAPPPR